MPEKFFTALVAKDLIPFCLIGVTGVTTSVKLNLSRIIETVIIGAVAGGIAWGIVLQRIDSLERGQTTLSTELSEMRKDVKDINRFLLTQADERAQRVQQSQQLNREHTK